MLRSPLALAAHSLRSLACSDAEAPATPSAASTADDQHALCIAVVRRARAPAPTRTSPRSSTRAPGSTSRPASPRRSQPIATA